MECFIVYRNEIEGRIDPHFYKPSFIQFYQQLEKTPFEIKTIGEIAEKVTSGATPKSKGDAYTSKKKGIPFIRSGDISEDKTINFDDVLYIKPKIHNKLLKGSRLKRGDVLIAIVGATIGQVSIYDYDKEANINQAIALVRLKQGINPEYVKAFLLSALGQKQLNRIKRPVARANINLDEIKGIKIILSPLEVQNHIVQLMDNAYKLQKRKETQAQQLLDSINDYVLYELGIKIPEVKDQMTFVVYADDVKGGRIDPYYYQPKFEEVIKAVENGKYEVKELNDSFEGDLIKGTLPKEDEKNGKVKVLQIKNILRNGLIDISEYITAKNIFRPNQKINKGELIIVITGATIGKVGLWYLDEEFYLGGDMVKFKTNKEFNPYYIQAFLLSEIGQYQILREITGATNKHLSSYDVKTIKIPLPPLEIQNKIAEEVKRRMEKAEQLQKEAKEILEKAKQEVENIILNGENNEG